ncbi:MAG TPA: QueT transporter family protein, partial [Candidatus Bathyarchaeia archaeon]
ADALMPLAILFGWPAILGLGIGTVVGNFAADSITGFPSASIGLDIVGGSLVNLLAGFLAWKIGSRNWRIRNWNVSWFTATLVETALISVVVGGYLSIVFSISLALSILGILVGEVIAINIVGFMLLNIIGRARSIDLFKSWGLQINETDRNR